MAKFNEGANIGGSQKGPSNKVKGAYKEGAFGSKSKVKKAPGKRIKA